MGLPAKAWAPALDRQDQGMEKDARAAVDSFLASVELRALRMAEIATGDRDRALDLVQDAMMRLVRRYVGRPQSEWAPLFFRILQNRVRDWQRRESVRRRLFFWSRATPDEADGDWLEQIPDPAQGDAALPLQRAQTLRRLERALAQLPARQRETVELRLWQGLSVAQTAQAMRCSAGSVKTHLSRALAALRPQLEDYWP